MKKEIFHKSVLLQEVIGLLDPKEGEIVVDATLGAAGHAIALSKASKGIKIVGLEADPDTLQIASRNLEKEGINAALFNANFRRMGEILKDAKIVPDKILFDLGMSEFSIFASKRGFSFKSSEPLDMRYDPRSEGLRARDIVNEWSAEDIANVLKGYGEERFARRIAREIVRHRENSPIETASDLVSIVEKAKPIGRRSKQSHPATKTFQALRVAVNDELGALEEGLKEAFGVLRLGGRIAVISFHSIEDRIVKNYFKERKARGEGNILTKKPISPSPEEISENPKARSAKLRGIEKLSE